MGHNSTMKKITFFFLVAAFLMQWFVPLNMIMQQETILLEGTTFKFKTQPIDPNDPFRGKFVVLNYAADRIAETNGEKWQRGAPVFVRIQEDDDGYAAIASLEKVAPIDEKNYVKAEIAHVWGENPSTVRIKYPFERFYMEETKAPKAEAMFRDLWRDSTTNVYGLVVINEGKAALEDVLVDGVSIREAVMAVE